MASAYKGADLINETRPLVQNYLDRKLLSSLGYRFDIDELETWEVDAYRMIASKFSELEEKEMKRKSKSRKK